MDLRCEGCAGCCVDWRPLAPNAAEPGDRSGRRPPLDDTDDLAPLARDGVAAFVDDGLGDVLVPRLFEPAERDDSVRLDGVDATVRERLVRTIADDAGAPETSGSVGRGPLRIRGSPVRARAQVRED